MKANKLIYDCLDTFSGKEKARPSKDDLIKLAQAERTIIDRLKRAKAHYLEVENEYKNIQFMKDRWGV